MGGAARRLRSVEGDDPDDAAVSLIGGDVDRAPGGGDDEVGLAIGVGPAADAVGHVGLGPQGGDGTGLSALALGSRAPMVSPGQYRGTGRNRAAIGG